MLSRLPTLIISLLFLALFAFPSQSQDTAPSGSGNVDSNPAVSSSTAQQDNLSVADRLANWSGTLVSFEQALSRVGLEDDDLARMSVEISSLRLGALELEQQIAPQVTLIKEQLDELGPVPKEGEPAESDEIAKKRLELEQRYSASDGEVKAARLTAVRSAQTERQIIDIRRHRFVTQISKKTLSLFHPQLWSGFWQGLEGFDYRFSLLISESVSAMVSKSGDMSRMLLLILGGAGLIAYGVFWLRRALGRLFKFTILTDHLRRPTYQSDTLNDDGDDEIRNNPTSGPTIGEELSAFTRIQLIAISFISNGLVPIAAIAAFYYLLTAPDILTTRFENLLREFALVVGATFGALALTSSFLAVKNPSLRIVNLSQPAASATRQAIFLGIILLAGIILLNEIAVILVSPVELSIGLSALMALAMAVALGAALIFIASNKETTETDGGLKRNLVRWGYLGPLFWLLCFGTALSLVMGYIAFAEFLTWQVLIAAFVFATLWLCLELLDYNRDRYLDPESERWRGLARATGFSRQAVLQGTVFAFGLVKLATILVAAMVFLISWGYRTGDWTAAIGDAFFGFKIGDLTISLSAIALAVIIFIAGYIITRAIQHWLRTQFLPTTALDPGLRNSIATIFGYGGIVLAVLLAITTAGLDLSKVAIVAGALSVGIGFGLQSIVSNFVSGLILLAERPIKSGDWIITSGGEGTVRKTSVRSTEIETFDGATVVIPNSNLITDAVTNWTHHSHRGRIKIAIGVGYDSNPERVQNILLECAKAHQRVLKRPAPNVFFMDFGADALVFELRAYLADINNSISTKSDLRFAILKALRQAKIEIPYPQRDLHIKSAPASLSALNDGAATSKRPTPRAAKAKPAAKSRRSSKSGGT